MSKPVEPTRADVEKILLAYREHSDMAWSEVTDKVHTVEEYQKAHKYLLEKHTEAIMKLLAEQDRFARVDELQFHLRYDSGIAGTIHLSRYEVDERIAELNKTEEEV